MSTQLAELFAETIGDVMVASIEGEIDMSNATSLGDSIGRRVSNSSLGLVLDLSRVRYLDSAAIQVIFDLHRQLTTGRQQFSLVVEPDADIARALALAGVPAAVPVHADRESALSSITAQGESS